MENNMSEFLKMAYKRGKVKELQEAFEEYPVENEWHKGEEDFFISEDTETYNRYSIGDIVFVKNFMYENGQQGQNHLFVIVDENNLVVPIDYFGMLISSQLDKLKYGSNKPINKSEENGLNKDSLVKTDVIYKLNVNQILFKIGSIDEENVEKYKNSLLEKDSNNSNK